MSDGEVRKVSLQDIQLVQNLIERCLQLYMSQKEVVSTLLHHAKIEPGFTELVWQKLEAENQEFFKAYHLRLIVKDQILLFNQLLERQVELMRQICSTGAPSNPLSNGSQFRPMHNNSMYGMPDHTGLSLKPENMNQDITTIPNAYTNGASSLQPRMQVSASFAGHAGRIDMSADALLAQSSNSAIVHGMNGGMKSEVGYGGDSPFIFGVDNNLMEPRPPMGDASISPFGNVQPSSQALHETILDPNMNSFGLLGQIPRNFSLSDLTADFSNSTDILETYSRSPFLGTDTNFLDPHIREQQDIKRLDTISEGFSYEDFGGD